MCKADAEIQDPFSFHYSDDWVERRLYPNH
jgi:hypothetical protein